MAQGKYRGRHRSSRRSTLTPRLLGAGLAVPTTATVVVAALSSSGSGAGSVAPVASHATLDDSAADAAELAAVKAGAADVLSGAADRAARGSQRQRLDAVTAENQRRAAAEAAQATDDIVVDVKPNAAASAATPAAADPVDPTPPAGSPRSWVRPVDGYVLTSMFGYRWGRLHPADDLACPPGTLVKAMSSGTVIKAGWEGPYGNKVEIRYWDGTVSWFAHNSKLKVKVGDAVVPGQVVALSGNTGHSTGPHVHVEIHPGGGSPVNPLPWFKARGIAL